MKIVFVTSHLTVFVGGGKFLMDFANLLSRRNNDIVIIAQNIDMKNYFFNKSIKLITVGGPLPSNPLFWLCFNKIKRNYLKIINKIEFDLLVSLDFPSNFFCSSINNKKNSKYIYYCLEPYRFFHDIKFYKKLPLIRREIISIIRFIFKKYDIDGTIKADKIVAISKFTAERVRKYYNKTCDYIHYIGVDINPERSNLEVQIVDNLNRKSQFIFSLGLTHHLKGVTELLQIFARILKKCPEINLLIGGWIAKENKRTILKLIKKLKIPIENIHLIGFIKNENLNWYYRNAIVTLYTAIDESYGLIPLESMKNGTPVIAFEGGPSETIINGKTGFIIKNYNLDEFAYRVIELIKNKSLTSVFSKNSVEHIKNNFNLQKSLLDLESIFRKITFCS